MLFWFGGELSLYVLCIVIYSLRPVSVLLCCLSVFWCFLPFSPSTINHYRLSVSPSSFGLRNLSFARRQRLHRSRRAADSSEVVSAWERHLSAGGEAGRPDAGAVRVGRQRQQRRHHLRGAQSRAGELPRGHGEPHHQVWQHVFFPISCDLLIKNS